MLVTFFSVMENKKLKQLSEKNHRQVLKQTNTHEKLILFMLVRYFNVMENKK